MHTCGLVIQCTYAQTRGYWVSCSFIMLDAESLTEPGVGLVASKPQQSVCLHAHSAGYSCATTTSFYGFLDLNSDPQVCVYLLTLLNLRPFLAFNHLKIF